jgi:F-type H+-transporting ATPase subunit gamma
MAGLKEIRTRIVSVKTTRQVTSAMKMVSASRLKKAQDAILRIRPYAEKLQNILTSLSASLSDSNDSVYAKPREPEKILVVLISSNRGLCGGFNLNIAKKAVELVNTKYSLQNQLEELDIICIGKQGERQVKTRGMHVVESYHDLYDHFDKDHVFEMAEKIMKWFVDGKYDRVELVYNQFLNAAIQNNVAEQFLPVEIEEKKGLKEYYDYIFEPTKEYIVKELIPRSLKIQFYKAMLDSHAAEHGARMTAMHQATDNATELLKDLSLQYNKLRQASITNEILEIVGGAEALRG